MAAADSYVPAAGRAAFTRLYDPVLRTTMRERRWRPAVAREALRAGPSVVDIGAGTGAQSYELARDRDAQIVAVDGDPSALALARAKDGASAVTWRLGMADALPIDSGAADAVVMTLLLHHLDPDGKRAALSETYRVLRAGGRLVVADWGRPRGLWPAMAFRALMAIDGVAGTADHAAGRLPHYLTEAGFEPARLLARLPTAWGTLEVLVAERA